MKITKILCLTATAVLVTMHTRGEERAFDPVEYANPLIGTQSTYELSTGNTYPAIARPWGMNFWTPQTGKMGNGWIYVYTADKIRDSNRRTSPVRGSTITDSSR